MPSLPVVKLEPWEYTHAATVAAARHAANWGRGDARYYHRDRMEDDRTAQFAACVAELAVAKHTNRYWSGHAWHVSDHPKYSHLPDVGANIEVRRVRNLHHGPAVRRRQLGKHLILYAAYPVPPDFREAQILGWLAYDDAWEVAEPSRYDPANTRIVPLSALRHDGPRMERRS